MTETDRELLKLAAKASGIGFDLYENEWYGDGVGPHWDPLTDDGDALRMAVKLGLTVAIGLARDCDGRLTVEEDQDIDDCAATRRAIVRAAAEIGKDKP